MHDLRFKIAAVVALSGICIFITALLLPHGGNGVSLSEKEKQSLLEDLVRTERGSITASSTLSKEEKKKILESISY